jgi:hypothetical protein
MKSKIIGRVEEWWKSVCQKHECKYYIHNDYPLCSYCTCPDNCIIYSNKNSEVIKDDSN